MSASLHLFGVPVYLEPHLEWECWRMERPRSRLWPGAHLITMGRESYPQLVYAVQVKPHVLETDPGPLDARVP